MNRRHILKAAALCLIIPASALAVTGAEIRSQIDAALNQSSVAGNTWTVLIENQAGTSIYYERNPDTRLIPASNTKLYTSAAAYELLGWDHVWPYANTTILNALYPINKNSDNEDADELLRYIGQQRRGSATFSAGGAEVLAWCTSRGINMTGAVMQDGSGLSYSNRFSARQTLHLIRYMLATYTAWDDTLSIGCVDGTIGGRFCGTPLSGRVHAKTGSLSPVIALSGYIRHPSDGKIYLFSFIANNVSSQTATREAIDDAVLVMAQSGIPELGNGIPGVIVDNATTDYAEAGTWTTSTSPGFYGTNTRFVSTGNGSISATWTGVLDRTGRWEAYAWWVAGANRANNAPYRIDHAFGSDVVRVNQTANGSAWNSLGTFVFDGGAASITLSNDAEPGRVVIADAVQWVYRGEAEYIVDNDNASSGFSTVGTWGPSTGAGFYGTTSLFANVGASADEARWAPNLPGDGEYDVEAWWVASTNRVTNANYVVNHATGTASYPVNQTTNGGRWNLLGRHPFRGGDTGLVSLADSGTGAVVSADAVRFVYRAPATLPAASSAQGFMLTQAPDDWMLRESLPQ